MDGYPRMRVSGSKQRRLDSDLQRNTFTTFFDYHHVLLNAINRKDANMTSFLPLVRIRERISNDKEDSDNCYFMALLYGCELITKLMTAAFVAAIQDDPDRQRLPGPVHRLRAGPVRRPGRFDL